MMSSSLFLSARSSAKYEFRKFTSLEKPSFQSTQEQIYFFMFLFIQIFIDRRIFVFVFLFISHEYAITWKFLFICQKFVHPFIVFVKYFWFLFREPRICFSHRQLWRQLFYRSWRCDSSCRLTHGMIRLINTIKNDRVFDTCCVFIVYLEKLCAIFIFFRSF